MREDFDGNGDFDHDDAGVDFKLPFEFYDNHDSTGDGDRDGFRAIEGVIPAGGVLQVGGVGSNIFSVQIDWRIHNDLAPEFDMENVWIVWEFADDPGVAGAGQPSGNKFTLAKPTRAHQTIIAPGIAGGDGCYVPAEFVAALITPHTTTALKSTFFSCDIPTGAGTFGDWLLARQGTTDDVLFNRSISVSVSNFPQHMGQDISTGPALAPQSVGGTTGSDVSVWFEVKGACCTTSGCQSETELDCTDLNGTFFGEGTTCGTTDCSIPTVSEWGLIVMTLLLLTAGTVIFGRQRRPAAA